MKNWSINKNRFEAFSDGVFAIAATLLILELRIPEPRVNLPDGGLTQGLLALWPLYIVYVASFATIGIMWINHHALFHSVTRVSYPMMIFNLLLLMLVAFLPIAIEVLSKFGLSPAAVEFNGLIFLMIAIAYGILYYVAAPAIQGPRTFARYFRSWTFWNSVGAIGYLLGIAVARFSPIASIIIYALVAVYYALPSATRALVASGQRNEG